MVAEVKLTFSDGTVREYAVSDEIEKKILAGCRFTVETSHPLHEEHCVVSITE